MNKNQCILSRLKKPEVRDAMMCCGCFFNSFRWKQKDEKLVPISAIFLFVKLRITHRHVRRFVSAHQWLVSTHRFAKMFIELFSDLFITSGHGFLTWYIYKSCRYMHSFLCWLVSTHFFCSLVKKLIDLVHTRIFGPIIVQFGPIMKYQA